MDKGSWGIGEGIYKLEGSQKTVPALWKAHPATKNEGALLCFRVAVGFSHTMLAQ